MTERIDRFLASPPRRITDEAIRARRSKALRKARPSKRLGQLVKEQENRCYYCAKVMRGQTAKRTMDIATLEHLTPISRGGDNRKGNTVAACQGCNRAKGNMTEAEYRAKDTPQ